MRGALDQFSQSPNLSNLTGFEIPQIVGYKWTHQTLQSLLTSPIMSNDLVSLEFPSHCSDIVTDELIEVILTAHTIPGDETSPIKFGKLQKLDLSKTKVGSRSIELIVKHLPHLTHLSLERCENINDAAVTALIANEHEDLCSPYPVLENLIELVLTDCPISDQGCITLSKSQLLDQLERLDLNSYPNYDEDGNDEDGFTDIGLETIFKTKLFSNMKFLDIYPFDLDLPPALENCLVTHG